MTGPWVLMGDFNEILCEMEKKGGVLVDQRRCFKFRSWVNKCGLINVEAASPRFTWRGLIIRGFG